MKRIALVFGIGSFVSLSFGLIAAGCGSGGNTTTGTGGASAGTGGSGSGGATGSGGSVGATGGSSGVDVTMLPQCLPSTDPNTQIRGNTCTPGSTTQPDCMVRCGAAATPDQAMRGYRPLQCIGGVFVQGTCYFPPALNYSCYKLPTPPPPCPAATQSGQPCTAAACSACGDGVNATAYMDSTGALKAGFCLCAANSMGAMVWTCGSNKEYPCYSPIPLPASCN